ncbi:MAG TPA: ABC transporter ATP-binding protein [Aliidongia sp.]|uniref:ABC transporter ATP-binding protein n=1 Tax=Aliidongia sp. TaxID=1914230 RepID=UPI002DDCFA90|nr:ABC transporter ATP-binding protein [Aliidongia sp.]HEV2677428.1 ABC transporter ATP-binding protein [Aliidongia sp.]
MILSLEVRRKRFAGRDVLGPLAFTLDDREILAIVGPSGCGKSTLLRIVGGLDPDYEGSLSWGAAGRQHLGTVFQAPRLLPWRTVRQNLDLVLPAGSEPAAGDTLLRALDLWPARDAFASTLSVGMARRLAIARAFIVEPELVLLDEPFVSLDEAMAGEARQLLLDAWQRRPMAALLVTHDLVEAASLADRILLLSASPARIIQTIAVPAALRRRGGDAAVELAHSLRGALADHFLGGG